MVKVRKQAVVLVCGDFKLKAVAFAPDGQIALDPPLGVEHQVPRAGVAGQVVHHVGDHAAEPAKSVLSADGDAAEPAQVVTRGVSGQSRRFSFERVQPKRSENTTISSQLMRGSGGFK